MPPGPSACSAIQSSAAPIDEPVTTIPTSDQTAEMELGHAAYEERRRVFIEEELPLLDSRISETLTRTHPTGKLTVGLVLAELRTVPDMEASWEASGCRPGAPITCEFRYLMGSPRPADLPSEMGLGGRRLLPDRQLTPACWGGAGNELARDEPSSSASGLSGEVGLAEGSGSCRLGDGLVDLVEVD